MITKIQLSAIIVIGALVWALLLISDGVQVNVAWLEHFNFVIGTLVIILWVFDKWIWKWRIFRGWLVKHTDLTGTWRVELRSEWVDPDTQHKRDPIQGYVCIRQTFSDLRMKMFTVESTSFVLLADMVKNADGSLTLISTYRNEPKLSVRKRSPIHHGTAKLEVSGPDVSEIEGEYWTDRESIGEITLSERVSKKAHSYSAAKALYA
jgi:hypothetical protein